VVLCEITEGPALDELGERWGDQEPGGAAR
jgi:hypothetical protein